MEPYKLCVASSPTNQLVQLMEARKVIRSSSTNTCDDGDILRNLPEPILHYILSFVDMQYVVKTSLLSRKWRYLWTKLPFLRFNSTSCHDTKKRLWRDFVQFVDKALSLRQTPTILDFFCYSDIVYFNPVHMKQWVCLAVEGNVQKVHFQFLPYYWVSVVDIPHCLFACKSLTSLDLNFGTYKFNHFVDVPLPDIIDLPLLKYLCLGSFKKMSTTIVGKFFSGCPVLDVLKMLNCEFDESNSIKVVSLRLKHLTIKTFEKIKDNPHDSKITISAPNLISFTSCAHPSHEYSFDELYSLESANLQMEVLNPWDIRSKTKEHDPAVTVQDANRMIKCLKRFYGVKSLTLNDTFLKVASLAADIWKKLPTLFTNLKYLNLSTLVAKAYLQGIMCILQISRNVETLVIKITPMEVDARRRPHRERKTISGNQDKSLGFNMSECLGEDLLMPQLRNIKVEDVEAFDIEGILNVLEFLKTLLKNAVALKKLSISFSISLANNEKEMSFFTNELLACPRGSSNVEILILP